MYTDIKRLNGMFHARARLAQSLEHQTFNLRVKGSSPLLGEKFFDKMLKFSDNKSVANLNNLLFFEMLDMIALCGATGIPVSDVWMRLPYFTKTRKCQITQLLQILTNGHEVFSMYLTQKSVVPSGGSRGRQGGFAPRSNFSGGSRIFSGAKTLTYYFANVLSKTTRK